MTHCIFWPSDISGVVAHKDLILCMVYHKEAVKWQPISPIFSSHLWQDVFEIWIKEIMFVFLKGFKISNFQYESILNHWIMVSRKPCGCVAWWPCGVIAYNDHSTLDASCAQLQCLLWGRISHWLDSVLVIRDSSLLSIKYCVRNKRDLDNLLLSFIMCIIPFIESESCVIRLTLVVDWVSNWR